jgi:uncharacterized damage-inducible protein DinB
MDFELDFARDTLSRTPVVLHALLWDLPGDWAKQNEGEDTWSPYDVVGHLIHGELTDWIPRTRIILQRGLEETFEPFDRFAQFESSAGKSLNELLEEFAILRKQNLEILDELDLTAHHLTLESRHPEFGVVTLRQMLSTWVVHDLDHIGQIVRVMASGYASEVGPWSAYLRILGG